MSDATEEFLKMRRENRATTEKYLAEHPKEPTQTIDEKINADTLGGLTLEQILHKARMMGGGGPIIGDAEGYILEQSCSYLIRATASRYEAINGSTGKIDYHTDDLTDVGSLLSVLPLSYNLDKIVLKGNFNIKTQFYYSGSVIFDFREATLFQPNNNNLDDWLLNLDATGASGSIVLGGVLDGNRANGNSLTKGILTSNLHGGLIQRFENTAVGISSGKSIVDNVYFNDCLGTGIDGTISAIVQPKIINNHFEDVLVSIRVLNLSLVKGNTFAPAFFDSVIFVDAQADNNVISGNSGSGNALGSNTGIRLYGGDNNIVANNRLDSLTYGILETSGAVNNLIQSNHITAVTTPITVINAGTVCKGNFGFNPYGKITNPFKNSATYGIGLLGTAATPTASRTYVIQNLDCLISSTNSGNNNNAIVISDPAGNQINPTTLSTLDAYYLPIGYKINWGAFTGAAPTVVACGV